MSLAAVWLSMESVAELLDLRDKDRALSTRKARLYCERYRLPLVRRGGRCLLVARRDVEATLRPVVHISTLPRSVA